MFLSLPSLDLRKSRNFVAGFQASAYLNTSVFGLTRPEREATGQNPLPVEGRLSISRVLVGLTPNATSTEEGSHEEV